MSSCQESGDIVLEVMLTSEERVLISIQLLQQSDKHTKRDAAWNYC